MTPRELQLYVDDYKERIRQEQEARIVQAYHTARFYRAKKMPALKKVLESMREKQQSERAQSPTEMLAFAKTFMERYEGKE